MHKTVPRFSAATSTAAIAVAIVVVQLRLVGNFRVDDAYISFAFSKSLAHGDGLTFGHERVEGYTNFLWTVVNAVPIRAMPDADPLIAARVLCVVALFGLLLATFMLARVFVGPVLSAVAVVCLASWTDLVRAAVSGLETVPHAMLLAFGILHNVRELAHERPRSLWWFVAAPLHIGRVGPAWVGACALPPSGRAPPHERRRSLWWFVAAALTRISGITTLALVCAYELSLRVLDRKLAARALWRWAAAPLALFAIYFTWRFNYYQLPLPTTYYAKNLVAVADPDRAASYLWDALRDLGGLAIAPVVTVALARAWDRRKAFLLCVVLFEAACVVEVGGDWMPFNRFCVPLAAPLVVLFVAGLAEAWKAVAASPWTARVATLALGACAVSWVLVHVDSHVVLTPQERAKLGLAQHVKRHTQRDLYAVRELFAAIVREPADVLATDYGGVVGYYADAHIVEMWGLCNRDIALLGDTAGINPIYGKTCIECYRRFDPDYFHIVVPVVRPAGELFSHKAVVDQIFQGGALESVLRLRTRYATGRVLTPDAQRALFFVEKRRPGRLLVRRSAPGGLAVDYPFEPGGLSSAALTLSAAAR